MGAGTEGLGLFVTDYLVYFIVMCMNVLSAGVFVYHMRAWCSQRPKGGTGTPGSGVKDSCELPCRCWELNLGSQEEQPVLLTIGPFL